MNRIVRKNTQQSLRNLTPYESRAAEITTLVAFNRTEDILTYINQRMQAAFIAGMQVKNMGKDRNTDAAALAWRAGIEDPDTLSNLYSKEQGFKQ